jgi:hypothetical protein
VRWYLQHEDGHVITCQPKVWMDTGGFAMYIETVFPHSAFGWRIHCGVEVTELSTNKQHTLSGAVVAEGADVVDWPRSVASCGS